MAKFKQKRLYDIENSIEVYVGERKYFVFLEAEIVVTEVMGKSGKAVYRRVTSWDIETAAILRASGVFYDKGEEL